MRVTTLASLCDNGSHTTVCRGCRCCACRCCPTCQRCTGSGCANACEGHALVLGGSYRLLRSATLLNTVDGIVTVVDVGLIDVQVWVTVSGRVAVDEPAGVIDVTWIVKPERIGALVAASELVAA